MNIFYVSKDPFIAAESLCDRHVVKMILESCQMLSTAHRVLDGTRRVRLCASINRVKDKDTKQWYWKHGNVRNKTFYDLDDSAEYNYKLYQATHINHPSCVWARNNQGNYWWLYRHAVGLCREYTNRYGKVHKCERDGLLLLLKRSPKNISCKSMYEDPPRCMPEEYKRLCVVESYREYYKHGKNDITTWKYSEEPKWMTN